ncbi:P-loop containing nucleoside triphosphate hydrolase protein [Punctularia strigosozonata HHB-11173 SS5]|uniref:p-loop containing nucleoside triphosphate hydrolase protein n=1 Tax=Punctularia strigosozonata (strain HHB-11173) TaxID=741275 RepID=R7S2G3_PUNST|nr:P-loop containing nucleoside triphosphate hydrolase protein [Punctularia strigosozonata HHB-11173 SS5]EIN04585.1 P-loop containing nucleoside triphosphate hydrolase protein [Punctularia strigosozonata HHB-11173 SS5]
MVLLNSLEYEYLALTLLSALFIPCVLYKICELSPWSHSRSRSRRPTRVTRSTCDALAISKSICTVVFATACAASLTVLCRTGYYGDPTERHALARPAYVLQLFSSLTLVPAMYLQHTHGIAPSTLLTLFFLGGIVFDSLHLRTLVLSSSKVVASYAVAASSRFVLLILELVEKRRLLQAKHRPRARETTSSLLSRLTFVWLIPLLASGRRRSLTVDDLLDYGVPDAYTGKDAGDELLAALQTEHGHGNPGSENKLLKATIMAFSHHFFAPVLPQLLLIVATFAQTYLVQGMLSFVSSYRIDGVKPENASRGWALVGGYVLVYLAIAASTSLYWDKVYAFTVYYRGALISVIFEKTLKLSSVAARSQGAGSAISYMTVDVERIIDSIAFFHQAWSAIVSIAVAAVILWYQASYAMFAPLGVILFFIAFTTLLGKTVDKAQMEWMAATEKRMKLLTSVVSHVLPIKLSALESVMVDRISRLRGREVRLLRAFYRRIITVGALSTATVNFAGLAALGTYIAITSQSLEPSKLFTILTVVNLVILPISTIGHVFPLLIAGYASLRRVSTFLSLEEKQRYQAQTPTSRNSNDSLTSHRTLANKDDLDSIPMDARSYGQIILRNASFSPSCLRKPILHDLSITFKSGALTMIIGPVGCGKSFLLLSLLRETCPAAGHATQLMGRVAYASQDPFLLPTTVRANIVLDKAFDPVWYTTVVKACCLVPDLARMDKGDMTVISDSNGLSGGQKHRVALARALYAKSDVILLDDSFSALDARTSSSVFSNLFGSEGLLRTHTTILVTHNDHHLRFAHDIVILDEGRVVAQGDLESLLESAVDVSSYITSDTQHSAGIEMRPRCNLEKQEREPALEDVPQAVPPQTLSDVSGQVNVEGPDEKTGVASAEPAKKDASSPSGWAQFHFFFSACRWPRLAVALASILGYSVTEVGLQIFLKSWSESDAIDQRPWLWAYAVFAVACGSAAFIAFFSYTQQTTPHASLEIHHRMLSAVAYASPTTLRNTKPEKLINRFSGDMNAIDFAFPLAILDFTITAAYVVGAMILVFLAVPWLAVSLPVLCAVYWLLQSFYLATSRQLQGLEMAAKAPLVSTFSTTFSGLETIRAYGTEKFTLAEGRRHLASSQAPVYFRYAGIRFLRTALNGMTLFIAVAVATLAVALRNSTSAGFLGVALSQIVGLSTSISNLLLSWSRVENGVVSVGRIQDSTAMTTERFSSELSPAPGNESEFMVRGDIEFRNVSLAYGPGLKPALRDVSFAVRGGSKIALCGRTGSGKSSVLLALLSGVDKNLIQGEILVDGVDVNDVPFSRLRSSMSVIFQDPLLLGVSVRENLTLRALANQIDPPSEGELWNALSRVGLADVVRKLDDGLDTVVDDEHVQLSRGERQLLCLARVLLEKRNIIIFDEVSSSMDSHTEARLHLVLSTDLKHCTVISIVHRISSVLDFDKVLVLDDGVVVEDGRPKDLLQSESRFRELARAQDLKD